MAYRIPLSLSFITKQDEILKLVQDDDIAGNELNKTFLAAFINLHRSLSGRIQSRHAELVSASVS